MEFYKLINDTGEKPYYAIIDDSMVFFYKKENYKRVSRSYHMIHEKIYKKLQYYRLITEEDEIAKLLLIHEKEV